MWSGAKKLSKLVKSVLTKDDNVGETVSRNQAIIHSVRIVESNNLKNKCWHRHKGVEPTNPCALLGRDNAPPFERRISKKQRNIQRYHSTEKIIKLSSCQHDGYYLLALASSCQSTKDSAEEDAKITSSRQTPMNVISYDFLQENQGYIHGKAKGTYSSWENTHSTKCRRHNRKFLLLALTSAKRLLILSRNYRKGDFLAPGSAKLLIIDWN